MLTQSRTGALLHRDHMQTMETLQQLEELLAGHRAPPPPETARPLLERFTAALGAEVGGHFGFEETHLFPEFLARGESGIVMMLTHEHRTILPLAELVAELARKGLADGFTAEEWKRFQDVGGELVEREMFHIQKEEMGLLAAISALLDAETDARLAAIFEAG